MRKIITAAVAALTLGGAMVATTAPAEARPYGHGGYYHGGGGYRGGGGYYHGGRYYGRGVGPGAAIAAGVAGLAVGAALASPRGYYGGGYGGGYGYPGYAYPAYGYGYRTCIGQHWVWDPYYGRNVLVQDRYAC
jgi:hypothetical protein